MDPELQFEPATHLHATSPTQSPTPSNSEALEKGNLIADPEQQGREQSEFDMREAIAALAKSSNRGSRFARTAAKRTILALQSDSHTSEESDESEEDPDDNPTIEPLLVAKRRPNWDNGLEGNEFHALEDQANGSIQIQKQVIDTPDVNAANQDDSSASTELDVLFLTKLDTSANTAEAGISKDLATNQTPKADNKLVRVYTVKMLQIIDGEEQPHQEFNQFLNLSDANSFAKDKAKEHELVNASSGQDCIGELFNSQIIHDDTNRTQIWVVSEIIHWSQIPNFDPELLQPRLPASSWLIRFETIMDTFNNDSGTWTTCKTSDILPNHHYSDVELANYAACEYLIQFLKPPRPVIDHLEQYENDIIPQLRRGRDDCCELKEAFTCEVEKDEVQVKWMAEKQLSIQVVCYQMQGPLN